MLTRQDGLLENVLSTEPAEFKLNSFLSKIGRNPIGELNLTVAPESAVDAVYPLQDSIFSGSLASWVGAIRRRKRTRPSRFTVARRRSCSGMSSKANLARRSPRSCTTSAALGPSSRGRFA